MVTLTPGVLEGFSLYILREKFVPAEKAAPASAPASATILLDGVWHAAETVSPPEDNWLADQILSRLKFNESDWVRNSGRFAAYVGQGGGSGGGGGAAGSASATRTAAEFVANATESDIVEMYSIPGVEARVAYFNRNNAGLYATVDFYTPDGARVGRAERTFHDDGRVHHDLFTVSKEHQGEGLAARINEHAEQAYRRNGFDRVELEADITIGKYAWARQGYDFSQPEPMNDLYSDRYRERLWEEAGRDADSNAINQKVEALFPPGKLLHAWEIAALDDGQSHAYTTVELGARTVTHPPVRLGKALMLDWRGDSWNGVKSLKPGSASTKIGGAYYAQKPGTESYQKRIDQNERRRRQAAAERGQPIATPRMR